MKRENDYDNDGLDQLKEYFRKKKVMMGISISLKMNQNLLFIKSIKKLNFEYKV